jgi:hypothetical protein
MAGLAPAIHVFEFAELLEAWMPATGAGMTSQAPCSLVLFVRFGAMRFAYLLRPTR